MLSELLSSKTVFMFVPLAGHEGCQFEWLRKLRSYEFKESAWRWQEKNRVARERGTLRENKSLLGTLSANNCRLTLFGFFRHERRGSGKCAQCHIYNLFCGREGPRALLLTGGETNLRSTERSEIVQHGDCTRWGLAARAWLTSLSQPGARPAVSQRCTCVQSRHAASTDLWGL